MAGIKIHASIDILIEHNHIHNTGRGIWIDWMAQGTRISGNILYDNTTDELGSTIVSESIFENPDGSQLILNKDISGNKRNAIYPMAGPIEKLSAGENLIEFNFPVSGN